MREMIYTEIDDLTLEDTINIEGNIRPETPG